MKTTGVGINVGNDGDVDRAMRKLKRIMIDEGIIREQKKRAVRKEGRRVRTKTTFFIFPLSSSSRTKDLSFRSIIDVHTTSRSRLMSSAIRVSTSRHFFEEAGSVSLVG